MLKPFPFSFEGTTGTYVCPPTGPGSVSCVVGLQDSENTFQEAEYEGIPASAEIILTWEPVSPAHEEMFVSLFAVRSCGDGCFESDGDMFWESVTGASPLVLSASSIELGEGEVLYLAVGAIEPNPSQYPVYFAYSVDQPFEVEGVLNALVPSA